MKFSQNVNMLLNKHGLFSNDKPLENELICGLEVKTMRTQLFSEHNKGLVFFQPTRYKFDSTDIQLLISVWMVKSFGSRVLFADENYHARCRSNVFNLYITVTVQSLFLLFCYGFGWHLTQIHSSEKSSSWTLYSHNLSICHGDLLHLIIYTRLVVALAGESSLFD